MYSVFLRFRYMCQVLRVQHDSYSSTIFNRTSPPPPAPLVASSTALFPRHIVHIVTQNAFDINSHGH